MSNFEWKGDKALKLADEASEEFLELAGIVVQGQAILLSAVDTGTLRQSIGYRVNKAKKEVVIGTNVHYAAHVEFGTKPHVIRAKNKKVLRNKKGKVFGPKVNHPGTKEQSFLRESVDLETENLKKLAKEVFASYFGGV